MRRVPSFDSAFCFSNLNTGALKVARRMTKLSFAFHREFIFDCFNLPKEFMKIKNIVGMTLTAALLAGCASEKESQEALQAEAKVSQADARVTALAQVQNGIVKESELEKEHGKLIWSFDIATSDSKDITEVNVDAINGTVVSKEKEKPEDEAKEAAEDAKKDKN